MNNYSIIHLFEFWKYIGLKGGFFTHENSYDYCILSSMSWPSKVFGIDSKSIDFETLNIKMKKGVLPASLGIMEDKWTEKQLLVHNFKKTSIVKGMYLNVSGKHSPTDCFPTIHQVETESQATEFALIAAKSFGHEIYPKTIISLLNSDSKIRLYLGSYNHSIVNCGIVFLDANGVSGIHMIGTTQEYRGLGLGRIMTSKLIFEAYKNRSKTIVLVATASGERIYSKMGFMAESSLLSYSVG